MVVIKEGEGRGGSAHGVVGGRGVICICYDARFC